MVSESRGRVHKGSPGMRLGFNKGVSGELQVSWDMGSGSSQLDETAGPSRLHVYEFFWPGNVIDRCIAVSGWGWPITAPNGPCPSRLITVPSGSRDALAPMAALGARCAGNEANRYYDEHHVAAAASAGPPTLVHQLPC